MSSKFHRRFEVAAEVMALIRVLLLLIQHRPHMCHLPHYGTHLDQIQRCRCWKPHQNPSHRYRSHSGSALTSPLIRHYYCAWLRVWRMQVVSYKPNRRRWRRRDDEQSSVTLLLF